MLAYVGFFLYLCAQIGVSCDYTDPHRVIKAMI